MPRFPLSFYRRAALPIVMALAFGTALVAETPAQEGEAEQPAARTLALEPPDGNWLKDEETGQEYFISELPKAGLWYKRVGDDMIRTRHGMTFRFVDETDEAYLVKIFKPAPRGSFQDKGPTMKELADAEATYKVEIGSADRLQLESFDNGLPRGGQWRHGFEMADMNGDSHLDLVHGLPRKQGGGPRIFLGDGAGNWSYWEDVTFPRVNFDYGDITVADWNGDGHQDVGLGMHMIGMLAMIGDGQGGFEAWSEGIGLSATAAGKGVFSSRQVEAVDWNSDGRPDLAAVSEGPRGPRSTDEVAMGKIIYINQGDGTWETMADTDPGLNFANHMEIADLNGDGRPDMLTGTSARNYNRLVNFNVDGETWEAKTVEPVRRGGWVQGVAVGDFDRDGRADLVLSYYNQELGIHRAGIDLLYQRDEGVWERRPIMATDRASEEGWTVTSAIATGDVDGDGMTDLVGVTQKGEGLIFLGNDDGFVTIEEEPDFGHGEPCQGYSLVLRDVDGDGRDEILAGFAGESGGCTSLGALRAWRVAGAATAATSSAAPADS